MTKMSQMLVVLMALLLVLSISVLAWEDDADVVWGDSSNNGTWGFTYNLGYDEDGNFVEEGDFQPYFRIRRNRQYNHTVDGAYIAGGQSISTTIGSRLGVNYSPYIANFHRNSRTLGIRINQIEYDLDAVTLSFDGTWAFSAIDGGNSNFWKAPVLHPRKNDIILYAGADFDLLDLNLDVSVLRYSMDVEVEDKLYDYSYNFAVEVGLTPLPGLDATGVYARYGQYRDGLYEVTANYEVLPEALWVRAGHRNTKFRNGYEDIAVVGGYKADDNRQRYIGNLDPLKDIYNRDFSINVGATYKFDYDVTSNQIDFDYDTTNPDQRGDFDDKITLRTNTDALGYNLWQEFAILFPDDETRDSIVGKMIEDQLVFDRNKNRLDYAVGFSTPKYDLQVPILDEVFVIGRINFDWDQNYLKNSRHQTVFGLELGIVQDIWRLPSMEFGVIVGIDMVSDNIAIEDPLKYALIARYDAPKGINFRLEYQNSADYANDKSGVHAEALNERYESISFYDNSKFHGIRFTVGFPI